METSTVVVRPAEPRIPLLDLHKQFTGIRSEILQAVEAVLDSQQFILGEQVELFEQEIGAFLGSEFAVGCASGTDALYLALLALGIGPGDEVITTPFTFIASAGSIARTGARPVFVDIEPDTFNIDPTLIEASITDKVRAILPVHLFGLAADLSRILPIAVEHELAVIEDAAQAIGATFQGRKVGTFGHVGCFSFFPSKNLGCAGDGGLVSTQNPDLADRLRLLRSHGSRKKYHYEMIGTNGRLDALQAAILRVKLRYLNQWTEARRKHAEYYQQLFDASGLHDLVRCPFEPRSHGHAFNQFVIRCVERDHLRHHLQQSGIPTAIYYPEPLHLQPAFSDLGYRSGSMPHSEAACRDCLALPMYPELPTEDQERIVRTIAGFYGSAS
jgi:dTDP-4-amino-4,6-dideoxygalactose transaminase